MKCKFCGRETESQFHEYCGFLNVIYLNGPEAEKAAIEDHWNSPKYKASQMYRDVTIQAIQDINVDLGVYKYNEGKHTMELIGNRTMFAANIDGKKCRSGMVKSKEWFAHYDGYMYMTIKYTFNGTQKSIPVKIMPKATEGLWNLGLMIRRDLKLDVYLCVSSINGVGKTQNILLNTVDLDIA